MTYVISRFGFEGWSWVLIASVLDLCTRFTFLIVTGKINRFFSLESPLNQNFFTDQNIFCLYLSYTFKLSTRDLTAVMQEVNRLKSSVVVQELEFATNLALYGLL